jgi:4-oxalocrotonate tautomerase family enzyme
MPIVRIESSIALPSQTPRAQAFDAVLECITRDLGVKPVQVRVAFDDVDPAQVMVAGKTGDAAPPWLIAWVSILEGRPEAQRATFVANLLALLAKLYAVDESAIRVLITDFPSVHWGMGRATATTKG